MHEKHDWPTKYFRQRYRLREGFDDLFYRCTKCGKEDHTEWNIDTEEHTKTLEDGPCPGK